MGTARRNHTTAPAARARKSPTNALFAAQSRRRAVEELLKSGTSAGQRVLLDAASGDRDTSLERGIMGTLVDLAEEGSQQAQEFICLLATSRGIPRAFQVALAQGYVPGDPHQRAIFHFLSGQWREYEALDYNHDLLRTAYDSANPNLRCRITEVARRSGRLEWVEVASGGRRGRRLSAMNDAEWETTLTLLAQAGRWEEMWRMAGHAPPIWSRRLIRALLESGWEPAPSWQREQFQPLARLATKLPGGFNGCHLYAEMPGVPDCAGDPYALSSNGAWAALRVDGSLRLLNVKGSCLAAEWETTETAIGNGAEPFERTITCLALSTDGSRAAGLTQHGALIVWALPSIETLVRLPPPERGIKRSGIWFSPTGDLVAVRAHGSTKAPDTGLYLYRLVSSGRRRLDLHREMVCAHRDAVTCLAFSPDDQQLYTGCVDGRLYTWDIAGRQLAGERERLPAAPAQIAASEDGQFVTALDISRTRYRWSAQDPQVSMRIIPCPGPVNAPCGLLLSPGGDSHIAASPDGPLEIRSLENGDRLHTLEPEPQKIAALAGWPGCGRILTVLYDDQPPRSWEAPLDRLGRLPLAQLTARDWVWILETLQKPGLSPLDEGWLAYMNHLAQMRLQFEVEIDDCATIVPVGEYDIEIEGWQ